MKLHLKSALVLRVLLSVFVFSSIVTLAQNNNNFVNHSFPDGKILVDRDAIIEMELTEDRYNNLETPLKKISYDLLQLLKPELLPSATSLEQHALSFQEMNSLKLDVTQSSIISQVNNGRVYVYIYLNTPSTEILNPFPIEITDRDELNHIAVAWVTLSDLETIVRLESVRSIQTVIPPVLNTGSVNTQGDIIHRTTNVRSVFNFNGTGINVGVVSDGVTNRSASQATGDLPPDGSRLTVLSNSPGGNEGTAILEIIHDLVPGSNLFFHGYGANTISFNTAITNLVNAGCKIIGDDIGWINEPFFQDGTVATHIKSLIAANNIIYVSAAGNGAGSHYQGNFYPIPSQPTQHFFGEGDSTDGFYLYAYLPRNTNIRVVLQWNDPLGASANNYNLYLFRINANNSTTQVASSLGAQTGTQDPFELINYTKPNNPTLANNHLIMITKGTGDPRTLELFIYTSDSAYNYSNNIKPQDAIFGHAALDEVVSVGAVNQSTPGVIEYFSSQGPSTIAFPSPVLRQTPKVVGVDFVSITGAGGFPNPFGGTSAAMPHIQGVLAQAWSKGLTMTGNQIKQIMYDYSFDLGGVGYDYVFGHGLADALEIFNNSPLPVELVSFSVAAKGNKVVLSWKTASEVNNYGFEIQRAVVGMNSQWSDWTKIGFVSGSGNSNRPNQYSYVDENAVKSGKAKYRLKQIDTDGKSSFSTEVEIKPQPETFALSQNYPNPFNPSTTIEYSLPVESFVNITIYNLLGQEVMILVDEKQESGYHQSRFDASGLSSGVYLYSIKAASVEANKTFSHTRKMQLIR